MEEPKPPRYDPVCSFIQHLPNVPMKAVSIEPLARELYGEMRIPRMPYLSASHLTALINGGPLSVTISTRQPQRHIMSSNNQRPMDSAFSFCSARASGHDVRWQRAVYNVFTPIRFRRHMNCIRVHHLKDCIRKNTFFPRAVQVIRTF